MCDIYRTHITNRAVNIAEGLPPFGSFISELLELNDDCMSNISDIEEVSPVRGDMSSLH